jgi:osmotically-inducible protein OsmY
MPTQLLASPHVESSDEQLARRVRNFILARILPAANFVQVEAMDGIVTLSGSVGTFYQKQLWLNGAQRVAGVRRVIDEIEVVPFRGS